MSETQNMVAGVPAVALRRVAIGLGQGVLLYLMFKAADLKVWPTTDRALFEGLLFPFLYVPLAAIHADGHLPRRTLLIWLAVVTLVCTAVGLYDGYRFSGPLDQMTWEPAGLFAGLAVGLLISEALLLAAHADGKRVPSYPTYFEALSKHAVQVAASAAFVGALWLVLLLGSALFKLIKLNLLQFLIEKPWFAIPVTTIGLAIALHVTDVRGGLVRGIRTLAHALLSWLMPVLALIVGVFLVSLPFTGLQPLWDTRFAAALLLGVAAILIVLVNAVYQDGAAETQPHGFLRWAMIGALALPAPLVAIAGHALYLRVAQYGWTTERVVAAACVVLGACFGAGYLAALARGVKRLETTNIVASCVAVALLFALLTPIADPVRIAVTSQIARLEDGRITVEMFDYRYLRFEGGRYGVAALERMMSGDINVAGSAARAKQAAELTDRSFNAPLKSGDIALNVTARGRALPESFLEQDWESTTKEKAFYPGCLLRPGERCEAVMLDLNGDSADEIILLQDGVAVGPVVLSYDGAAGWAYAGSLPRRLNCPDFRALLKDGAARTVVSAWRDIEIGGVRMDVTTQNAFDTFECAKAE